MVLVELKCFCCKARLFFSPNNDLLFCVKPRRNIRVCQACRCNQADVRLFQYCILQLTLRSLFQCSLISESNVEIASVKLIHRLIDVVRAALSFRRVAKPHEVGYTGVILCLIVQGCVLQGENENSDLFIRRGARLDNRACMRLARQEQRYELTL